MFKFLFRYGPLRSIETNKNNIMECLYFFYDKKKSSCKHDIKLVLHPLTLDEDELHYKLLLFFSQ